MCTRAFTLTDILVQAFNVFVIFIFYLNSSLVIRHKLWVSIQIWPNKQTLILRFLFNTLYFF